MIGLELGWHRQALTVRVRSGGKVDDPLHAGPWSNRHVLETPEEIDRLQELLDRSAAGAGAHLRGIVSDDRRLSAVRVCERLQGMRLLVVATVTADGRPLVGPVDGYFLHGSFYFSSGRDSRRASTRTRCSPTPRTTELCDCWGRAVSGSHPGIASNTGTRRPGRMSSRRPHGISSSGSWC
jgi:hypothetical protein